MYDFFVVADCLAHAVVSVHTLGDTNWEPHSGVRLLIRGGSSKIRVRQLKVPKRFGPTMQAGPANDPSIIEAWCSMSEAKAQADRCPDNDTPGVMAQAFCDRRGVDVHPTSPWSSTTTTTVTTTTTIDVQEPSRPPLNGMTINAKSRTVKPYAAQKICRKFQ